MLTLGTLSRKTIAANSYPVLRVTITIPQAA
jgi:hypothetical protein